VSIVILDNFDSFTYNLYQMVQAQTEAPVKVFRNNAIAWEELLALRPNGVILSPGPGHPANPSDFGLCRQVLQHHEALHCPILGVCLGHQGMAHYFGGKVIPAPAIVHGKTSPVRMVQPSPLLTGLPNPFTVMRYHSWMVEARSLPADFEVTAELCPPKDAAEGESSSLLIMAMQHKTRPLYGVQFHPESVGTPEGSLLLKNFLTLC
jgi:anthranilate synthase/aminodeoxychorismate synthase-like glutamine amidotransferase